MTILMFHYLMALHYQNESCGDAIKNRKGKETKKSVREKEIMIKEMGGIPVTSVTKKTDVLIVGGEGNAKWAYGNYGSKVKKALQMQEAGHPIVILEESEVFEK